MAASYTRDGQLAILRHGYPKEDNAPGGSKVSENAHDIDHVEADAEASKFRNGMGISLLICVVLIALMIALHEVFGG
jgi:hypothetical protein